MELSMEIRKKITTRITMFVMNIVCFVWKFIRCKLWRNINDFDYYVSDLRQQFPNQLTYHHYVGHLPFYCKTLEHEDEYEKTSSIKLGDCNIQYTFDKITRMGLHVCETKLDGVEDLITQTKIHHNKPESLRVVELKTRKEKDVVKLYSK